MGFRELLNRAKTMDDTAMVQIIDSNFAHRF